MKVDPSVKRVLIYRLGSLGDTIVALPCFHLIARCFPEAERILLTNVPLHAKAPAAESVLGASGLIHGCIRYDATAWGGLYRKVFEIRRFNPEVVVDLMWIFRTFNRIRLDTHFFRLFSGASRIVGVPATAEPRRLLLSDGSGLYERESHRLARLIRELGDAAPDDVANWDLLLTKEEHGRAREILGAFAGKPLIACGPGTKVEAKDWGQENWQELIKKLSPRFPEFSLVLVGAKEDHSASAYVAEGWRGDTLNLCGRLTPRETAAVLCQTQLFLGPDSGPMHLAAASGVPCAITFSARDYPGVWYPVGSFHRCVYHAVECQYCHIDVCVERKKKCLTSISVDEMFTAALEAWRDGQDGMHRSRASAASVTQLRS
jgi:ADP-heptose:LPS heptosyltransferase